MNGLNECDCDVYKKVDVKLLYNSVKTGDQLERRCARESQHLAGGASGPPIESLEIRPVGEKMLDWGTCPREVGPQGPQLSSPGERERNTDGHKSGGSICSSSVWSPTPSHTQPFQIKWEVYFSKELCRSSLLCRCVLHAYVDVYVLCVCIVDSGHGYTTPIHSLYIYWHVANLSFIFLNFSGI